MAGIGRLDISLGLDAAEYTAGLSRAEQEAKKFARSVDKQIASLQTQVNTLGYSERQLKIYELAQKGATREQLLSVNALFKQKEAFDAAGKATAAASAAAAKQKATSEGIDKQVKALHDQVAVQGKSERATKLYELAQAGATKEQLKSAEAALRQKAAYEATVRFMGDLGRAALIVGAALATAAVAGAVLFEKLVGKAASFQDLAEKTGASAEALASFQVAASVTNTSMDTLANLSVKLTKGLAGTDEETKQAANAIKQLGINVDEFKKLDPAAQFELIGKRLNEFADGSGKTAFAVAAMGRSGADALPFLKELGAQGQRNVVLTAAQIKAADDYKDAQARLTAQIELYATKLAIATIGPVTDFKKALFETVKQIIGITEETSKLAGNKDIENFAESGARSLAVLGDGVDLLVRGFQILGTGIGGAAAQITAFRERGLDAAREVRRQLAEDQQRIIDRPLFSSNLEAARARRIADIDTEPGGSTARPRRQLDPSKFGGGGGASAAAAKAAQLRKKQLDDQLSALDNFIKNEDRLLDARNASLNRLYDQDRISIKDYFDGKNEALGRNTVETAAAFDAQIDLYRNFASKATEETEKLDALTKLADASQKRTDFLSKQSQEATKLADDRVRATQTYKDSITELNAKLLELVGTEQAAADAARLRLSISNRGTRNRAEAENDTAALQAINALERRTELQERLNAKTKESQAIQERLGTAELKLSTQRDRGYISELDFMAKLGGERRSASLQLLQIADRFTDIANELKDPAMQAAAERFRAEIDAMAASADILTEKFRTEFKGAFEDSFEGLLSDLQEGKNALESFKDFFKNFTNDIVRNINRLATQSIADALFKGGGGSAGGAFAEFFAGLFGGQNLSGVFASGTDFVPRDGLAYLHRGERVIDAKENQAGGWKGLTVVNNFHMPPGAYTRATQDQIASDASRALNRASRRLG